MQSIYCEKAQIFKFNNIFTILLNCARPLNAPLISQYCFLAVFNALLPVGRHKLGPAVVYGYTVNTGQCCLEFFDNCIVFSTHFVKAI